MKFSGRFSFEIPEAPDKNSGGLSKFKENFFRKSKEDFLKKFFGQYLKELHGKPPVAFMNLY